MIVIGGLGLKTAFITRVVGHPSMYPTDFSRIYMLVFVRVKINPWVVAASILGPSNEADARKFHAPFQPKTPQLNRGFYTKTNLELKLSSNLTKQNQMISKIEAGFFFFRCI